MASKPNDIPAAPSAPVPMPRALPVIGHLHQIARSGLVGHLLSVSRSAPQGIFKLRFGSRVSIFVTDPDLVAELSDETRFRKMPGPALRVVRKFAGDGLFTAFSEEPNWGKAHRILLPAFSQRAMRGYFDMIVEVCDQLVAKWTRAAGTDVHVADDMTRLTLDSIAIAGFGHRFNSFEREELDSFLVALGRALSEALNVITRLPVQQRFARRAAAQYEADIAEMNALVDGIIADRRVNPNEGKDLLNLMLTAIDPETGEGLDDLNIRYQVLTFLIAGHETTSGMLTFAFTYLLRNPAVLAQAYAEVDRVLPGDARPDYAQVAKLEVIERVLKEALRLWPTAPAFSVAPFEDQVIGAVDGKPGWRMRKDRPVNIFTPGLHRAPDVWDSPEEFDIDRWLPEAEAARHPHAYKPFGNGERACIGRQFAMVEAKIALAMLLRAFAISDPHSYTLRVKETLSIKPDDFTMRVRLRGSHERLQLGETASGQEAVEVGAVAGSGQRFVLLYGTSLGTARDVAEEIAERARTDGFDVVVRSMDEGLRGGAGPADKVIVIVTATYNGRAPDSAVEVERALDAGAFDDSDWSGARYAVLGIGNSQWPNFQAFPKRVDATIAAAGGERLVPRGEADGQGDFDGAIAAFVRDLWQALGAEAEPAANTATLSLVPVDTVETRARALPEHAQRLEIVANDELVRPADGLWDFAKEPPRPSTRLVRVRLPEGQHYAAGDHLAIYARNRPDLVARALDLLGIHGSAQVRVDAQGGRFKHLPLGATVTVEQLLTDFVELSETVSRRALAGLRSTTRCPHTVEMLQGLERDYDAEVTEKRVSLLDLIERHPVVSVTLEQLIDWSAAIQPRFYSIASSPLVSPDVADLIVGTIAAPAWSGLGEHRGFASDYMKALTPGEHVFGHVRRPNPSFAPPADAAQPMILIGPGTGFAPLRGFLQERAAQAAAGEEVATSLLFFGCRHPDHDWFCRDEMEAWAADGLIDLYLAFSAVPSHPWRFVQDALWAEQERVWRALEAGASVFLCGDGRYMAPAVRDTLVRIWIQQVGGEHAQGSAWLEQMIAGGRFHQDVFGFGK
ncbi:cytochrome P450 / NADPH-cytochrome P450 reductase [Sphingomonas palmae]|uniref:Bifunctional cytochrome P450/NADPH--P450 reductase n=1 Tax=Sphingomonas palmae TaxID=1855283 RepID=A0A1H7HXN8_9SPHN|nr:cytochrome P450 [Sphingomonas palmae]SEK55019.1 cytochrome P450 / NADPH-cytochrome P450 reductase [Sphingomonas palmae]